MPEYSDKGAAASAGQDAPVLFILMEEWAKRGERQLGYMFDLNNVLSRMDVERAGRPATAPVFR